MRLIDGDALEDEFDLVPYDINSYDVDGFTYAKVCDVIHNFPTYVEAEIVRRGHWDTSDGFIKCSRCGKLASYGSVHNYVFQNYCSNCGSRMDGEKNEED